MSAQYFACIENGLVVSVHVVSKDFLEANPERYSGIYVETFIDRPNKTYAGLGYTYDEGLDDFVAPVYVSQAPYIEVPEP